jgi:hypothetical protein
METVEQVSLATRHQVKEGRRITLNVDHTHCLPDFNIHDNYLQGRDAVLYNRYNHTTKDCDNFTKEQGSITHSGLAVSVL